MLFLLLGALFVATSYAAEPESCYCGDTSVHRKGNPSWFMMAEVRDSAGNFVSNCYSSLISDRHVLTAKDCIMNPKDSKVILFSDDLTMIKTHNIKRFLAVDHQFSNIAIIEMSNPIDFSINRDFRPICLPFNVTMNPGKLYLDYSFVPNELKEIDDYENMTSVSGFPVNPDTHVTISRTIGWRDGASGIRECPLKPFTTLHSTAKSSWFATAILHTDHAQKFCADQKAKSVVFEKLAPHQSLFESLLKEGKTCPPMSQ